MFISSYSTYLQTNNSKKTSEKNSDKDNQNISSFKQHTKKSSSLFISQNNNIDINYISKNQSFIKQKIEFQREKLNKPNKNNNLNITQSFKGAKKLLNARQAYSDNSKFHSFLKKPKHVLNQQTKIDLNLPNTTLETQNSFAKIKMINTYISNNQYYLVTA